eukprot:11165130-Lingulodinium_polyedra.AAC.1
MPCRRGSVGRPVPAQYRATPRLPPEHMAGPGGQPGSRRISSATLAAQASAALAVAPSGKALVR